MNQLFKIVLCLVLLLFALGVVDFYVADEYWITDYVRGSFTETLGIILTVIFVEIILSLQQKKDEKKVEKEQLLRFNKLITIELDKCIRYASFMTQKIDEQNYLVEKDFEFSRLENFSTPSLSLFEGRKAYRLFANSIENIEIIIREFMLNCNFKYFNNLEKILLEYLDFVKIGTSFDYIEALERDENMLKMIRKMINDTPSNTVPKYEEHPRNVMVCFIRIYEIINFHIGFIERYKKEISLIDNNN